VPDLNSSDDGRLRLLAVHAHPDDESSKGAAMMAKYVREGVEVLVATCTGGERGSILNPRLKDREAELLARLPEVRREEMAAAAEVLGIEQTWLGWVDSGFPEADDAGVVPPLPDGCFGAMDVAAAAAPLVALIRRFRPHVVTTYDENGGYPHPDHVMCHKISVAAFDAAGDPDRYPDAGEPWQPLKLYYDLGFTKAKVVALNDAAIAAGSESPFKEWLERWEDRPEDTREMTTQVECAEYFALRNQALICHATQIDPDGPWFRGDPEVQKKAWPTEDFQLVRSLVDSPTPETDLFNGLRDAADPSRAAGIFTGADA
jgi:mycothiol S-conjugate amidase